MSYIRQERRCATSKKPTHKYHSKHVKRGVSDYCYPAPSASPYLRKTRTCEHADDYGLRHNVHPHGVKAEGYLRAECTSYNATCADDADALLRHCLPEVYVDHSEVRDSIRKERAEALDARFNMGQRRVSRFNDYEYVVKKERASCDSCKRGSVAQREATPGPHGVLKRGDAMRQQPIVGADADVFDTWPEIRSEFPIMVRRPDDYSKLYTKYY